MRRGGVEPTVIGDLPPQLAALIMTNVNVQSLAVEAALTGKREHVYHAAMLDPHTAAELTLDEIWRWSTTCSTRTATGSRRCARILTRGSDLRARSARPSASEPGEKVPSGFAAWKRGTESPS